MKAISTICIASWIAAAAAAQAPPVVEPKVKPKVPEERVRQHGDLISGTDHAEIAEQMKQDVLLRALVDELERGQSGLALQDLKRPYFIEFGLSDGQGARVAARLGAVISESSARSRRLRVDLRVGSYELDNTNFAGGFGGMGGGGGGSEAEIPIEDDYTAIRQALWWATDREYKQAVETFEQKEAFMESKVIENKPHDFAHQEPAVHFDERVNVSIEVRRLTELAREVSEVFLGFPEIKRSGVMLTAGGGQRYVVNSEGTRLRTSRRSCSIQIGASVQCDDGMEFSDTISVVAETIEDLPALEELAERCRAMAGQLLALRRAPKLDSYSGPVLFEPRAAAEIFAAQFARRFAGGQRPVGGRTEADDLEKKLGKRILPKFVDVVDDPTLETLADQPVAGHYSFDEQGVAARRLELVKDGRLAALLMSRNPSQKFEGSTGHGRGGSPPAAVPGCLVVSADPAETPEELLSSLAEACQDEDLEFGIRISSLGRGGDAGRFGPGGRGAGLTPLLMHKIYPDGREELVRGAEIARVDAKAFKRILSAGATPYVQNAGGSEPFTVAAPAMLFEELDLATVERDFDLPPIMQSPLARK